jgi:hypothetical protein
MSGRKSKSGVVNFVEKLNPSEIEIKNNSLYGLSFELTSSLAIA